MLEVWNNYSLSRSSKHCTKQKRTPRRHGRHRRPKRLSRPGARRPGNPSRRLGRPINHQLIFYHRHRRGMQRGLTIRLFIRNGRIYTGRRLARGTRKGTRTKRCPKIKKRGRRKSGGRRQTRCCCPKNNQGISVLRIPKTRRVIKRQKGLKNRKKAPKRKHKKEESKWKKRWMESQGKRCRSYCRKKEKARSNARTALQFLQR